MELRLLGPVAIYAAGEAADLGVPQRRALLAALAVDAGHLVSREVLIDRVWGDTPPARVESGIYAHVTRIRKALDSARKLDEARPATLRREPGGYLLQMPTDSVDLHHFRRLVVAARGPDMPPRERARLLNDALALHRGTPLAGIPGPWATRMRASWAQERLEATVTWAHAETELGNHSAVLGPLSELTSEHPLAESVIAELMRALAAAGRGAEALHQYGLFRRRLAEELGAEPGPELRGLHHRLLQGDHPSAAQHVAPSHLPNDLAVFAGRRDQLCRLDALLAAADRRPTGTIVVIDGGAGVGKTTLAAHWGRRVADRFPDGHLYVNLRGFDPVGRAVAAAEALCGFLEALGVPADDVPADEQTRIRLYRSLTAEKAMLVVLDNASDAEQVRCLLPNGARSTTVVTSRNQLTGLIATDGAHPLTIDVLPVAEARQLLAKRLGNRRLDAEPEALEEVIAACARLPLALAVAAARVQQTGCSLRAIADELGATSRRLDALDTGDPTSQVRTVFSWSYHALTPQAARLFRRLGLHPGQDVSTPAAASLSGLPVAKTRQLLAELTRASLVNQHLAGRFTLHDLLRAYATELANADESPPARRTATLRLLDHYTHTAHSASLLLHPARDPIPLPLTAPSRGCQPEQLADRQTAIAWLTAEYPTLLSLIPHACHAARHAHAWQLAWALDTFLYRAGRWHDQTAAWQTALDAATQLADPAARPYAARTLARGNVQLGRYQEALDALERALDLYSAAGDRTGEAHTRLDLALLWVRKGDSRQALEHSRHALDLYLTTGHRQGQASALNAVSWCLMELGELHQAIANGEQALALYQGANDAQGEAETWDTLGLAHHFLVAYDRAADCYRNALKLYPDLGGYERAMTFGHLGDTHHADGDNDAARAAWQRALSILSDLNHPQARDINAKLHQLVLHERNHRPRHAGSGFKQLLRNEP